MMARPGDVRGLALVGGHAERRVALQVLDGFETFALRQLDVGGGDVVLEVDEGLLPCRRHARAASAKRPRRRRQAASRHCLRGPYRRRPWRRPENPSRRQAPRPNVPLALPAATMPGGAPSGTKAAMSSRHFGRPRWYEVRPTAGFQPPETASPSASISARALPASATAILRTPCLPPVTPCHRAVQHGKAGLGRERAMGGGDVRRAHRSRRRPAIRLASAVSTVRQPSSLLVNSARRRAGVAA